MTINVPEQQLYDRWDILPMVLKEAIVSDVNSDFVWKAGEIEHLPKEKIRIVSKLAGYVLSGFLHPEDIAKEIQDALGINPNIAATIANTLNSRIFNPLRNELEKIYAPAVPETQQQKIVQEIERPTALATGIPVAPPPSVPTKTISGIQPQVAPKPPTAGVPPPPTGGPKIISTEVIPSVLSITPSPSVKVPEPPKPMPLASQQSSVISPAFAEASAGGQKSEVPIGPVIIHQESELAPIKSVSGFKLEIPQQESKGIKSDSAIPPRPAQIEIGPVMEMKPRPISPPPVVSRVEPRVVHYSESRTPLDFARDKPLAPFESKRVEILLPKPPTPTPIAYAPKPPSPPSNLPVMPQIKPAGIFDRLKQKISQTEKFLPGSENAIALSDGSQTEKPDKIAFLLPGLPDPLKEPELPKPEVK